jgi:hypothetical protein
MCEAYPLSIIVLALNMLYPSPTTDISRETFSFS